jgi:hypothetical protein
LPSLAASHAAPGVVEILELACNAARDNKKSHIIQLHVRLAVRIDEQLNTGGLSGVGGVPLAWLLLRHTVCAPRRRVVCGCICCAPACLLLLHCCADLRDNDPRAVSKVVCPSPPRTSLCGKPRRTAMSAGRNHMRIQLLLQTEGRARLVWARASRQRAIGASD